MSIIVKVPLDICDATGSIKPPPANYTLESGEYEVELVENPYGFPAGWLVLKGTKIGAAALALLQWGDDCIIERKDV